MSSFLLGGEPNRATIHQNDNVVIQKVGGEHMRVYRVTKKQSVLIEKLRFDLESAVGKPYGLFEVVQGKLRPANAEVLVAVDGTGDIELRSTSEITSSSSLMSTSAIGSVSIPEIRVDSPSPEAMEHEEDAVGNDEEAATSNGADTDSPTDKSKDEPDELDELAPPPVRRQKLTEEDILRLKEEGASSGDLVAKLVVGSSTFAARTSYAQSKYIRRKTSKHSDRVLILRPTLRLLTEVYYKKDTEKTAHLRLGQLGLILQLGSVQMGRRVLIFEQCMGLVTTAVVQRLAGTGICVHLHRGDMPQAIPALQVMSFDQNILSTFRPLRLETMLNDGEFASDEDKKLFTGGDVDIDKDDKRLQRLRKEKNTWNELVETGVDTLILAIRNVSVIELLERLWPRLRLSGLVVVYAPVQETLLSAHDWIRNHGAVNIQIQDQLYRVHQVLPDRTHPLMSQMVAGGAILSAIKVQVISK